jgi:hypothetical protein
MDEEKAKQVDEYHVYEGETCPNKGCNGVILVEYVALTPDGVKTWTCQKCGDTWSE